MYSQCMAHPLKGRGALSNPDGRFCQLSSEAVDDGWYTEEVPSSIATSVEPDHARSVISTNDSPDIPFDYSINPYRGCEHGCVYCQRGETPILMGDGSTRPLADLRRGDAIYGTVRQGWYRRYVKTKALAHWSVIKPAYRIGLEDGTTLVAGADHRFLTERGWKFVAIPQSGLCRPSLTVNNKLMGVGGFAAMVEKDHDYRLGYLCGLIRGDGTIGSYSYGLRFRLAMCDEEALQRAQSWLQLVSVATTSFVFSVASATRRAISAIHTGKRRHVEQILELIAWPPAPSRTWRAGFLAGIFDAEGSYSDGIVRISNTNPEIIAYIKSSLREFGFEFVVEHVHRVTTKPIEVVRVLGGLREHLRLFLTVDPAITRKRDISGQAVKSDAKLRVVAIDPLPAMRLYDIATGTEDFIANGVVSHNCYARPSHAYLGLSSGLDFETRLFYKADAARLLTAELARPAYVCKPIVLGANTDPYQPIEKRLKVTRSVLEVLQQCRHPVSIVTKGTLILRDLDILTDMAHDGLASVAVSVTTLDAELKRKLEPRAAAPQARLGVVRELAAAGIPVSVLVAPVIPAITDHELESIVQAAAAAGVRSAGYVLLRLPHDLAALFREWLAEHYPQRAQHVMSLVNEMRGGRDNDPRFGSRMRGTGPFAELLRARFQLACARSGIGRGRSLPLATTLFRPPRPGQLELGI